MSSYAGFVIEQAGITSTSGQLVVNLRLNVSNLGLAVAGSLSMELLGCKAMLLSALILMIVFSLSWLPIALSVRTPATRQPRMR